MTRAADIAEWLRQQLSNASARGLVVALSGGVDSAVVARLCQMAAPGRVVGVILPCHGNPQDEADARLVADLCGIPAIRADLAPAFDELVSGLDAACVALPADQRPPARSETEDLRARVPFANLKPRLRMSAVYFVANSLGYLVAGTGNRCEITIGYFTKHGDGGVDLLPLGRLLKSEVRAMARALDVPSSIIDKAPSAGLWAGQTDEAEMGFTYAELENYLLNGPDTVSPALGMRIERLMRRSEHKRALPPMPDAADA